MVSVILLFYYYVWMFQSIARKAVLAQDNLIIF